MSCTQRFCLLFYASEKHVRVGGAGCLCDRDDRNCVKRHALLKNLVLINTVLIIHANHSVQVILLFMKLHLCGNALQLKMYCNRDSIFHYQWQVFRKIPIFHPSYFRKKKVLQSWLKTSKLSGQVMMSPTAKEANNINSLAS